MSDAAIIDSLWNQASAACGNGDFPTAANLFEKVTNLLEAMLPSNPPDYPGDVLQNALSNAFFNKATCLLETCGPNINEAAHALIRSIVHGDGYLPAQTNLLFAMNMALRFHQTRFIKLPDEARFREIGKWHNEAVRLLKTPVGGTADRDWRAALTCIDNVLGLDQNWAPTLYLKGIALQGLGAKLRGQPAGPEEPPSDIETQAVMSWIGVKAIDDNYDFSYRMQFRFD